MNLSFRGVLRRERRHKDVIAYVSLETRTFLLQADLLDALQTVLLRYAPNWCAHVYREGSSRSRSLSDCIHMSKSGSLFDLVMDAWNEQCVNHNSSVAQLKSLWAAERPSSRALTLELRGATDSVLLIITVSDRQFHVNWEDWTWSNGIALHLSGDRIEGLALGDWIRETVRALVTVVPTDYGSAQLLEELHTKNMSRRGGGYRAIGTDISAALPGLYWLNVFGAPYVDLIGRERLVTAPAHEIRDMGGESWLFSLRILLHGTPRASAQYWA